MGHLRDTQGTLLGHTEDTQGILCHHCMFICSPPCVALGGDTLATVGAVASGTPPGTPGWGGPAVWGEGGGFASVAMVTGGGCHGDGAGDKWSLEMLSGGTPGLGMEGPLSAGGQYRGAPPAGEHCELSTRRGRCAPGVCRNGGTCVNLLVGGFRCECPPGHYEKPFCAMSTRSFPPRSFITFRGLRQRFHFTLTLT